MMTVLGIACYLLGVATAIGLMVIIGRVATSVE
jgi:hypothetical protein